jgi:hypothetical protein
MKYKWIILGAAVVVSGGLLLKNNLPVRTPAPDVANPAPQVKTYDYGNAVLKVGERAVFPRVTITPLEVVEDSRCAEGVQCVWAGTVKVRVNISHPSGNSSDSIELGKSITTATEKVELLSVTPAKKANQEISKDSYQFTFKVTEIPLAANPGKGGCYIGGCSAQLCTEDPAAISTCEYTATYACYKTAKCERQSTGKCGWTETPELKICLTSAH